MSEKLTITEKGFYPLRNGLVGYVEEIVAYSNFPVRGRVLNKDGTKADELDQSNGWRKDGTWNPADDIVDDLDIISDSPLVGFTIAREPKAGDVVNEVTHLTDEGVALPATAVESTSDERTVNNVMRHAYRVLTQEEKDHMQKIKDMGLEFYAFLDSIGSSRELSIAKTKIEESVMWAVKDITK